MIVLLCLLFSQHISAESLPLTSETGSVGQRNNEALWLLWTNRLTWGDSVVNPTTKIVWSEIEGIC
jgi:hypothetical protein